MFRVSLANAFAKRTLRPLLEKHQATPVAGTLGATAITAKDIYSGMVATLDSSTGSFEVCSATAVPWGLFALDHNNTIDDLEGQPSDLAPFAVWQGGPDAYFRIDTPAFDGAQSYSVGTPLFSNANGEVTSVDGTGPVLGTVAEVVSATRLVIQLMLPVIDTYTT